MNIIYQRKSISRTTLLIILFELTFVDKSISNQKICGNGKPRNMSYVQVLNAAVNWTEAWKRCKDISLTLPVICDESEQQGFANYLKTRMSDPSAWTSGKKVSFNEWKWINGQIYNGAISNNHESNTHVLLDANRRYLSLDPRQKTYYLCQYSGSLCNSGDVISVTKGCVIPSEDELRWYHARNQCIRNGGDLAILHSDDVVSLRNGRRLRADRVFWIGLRKNAHHWMWQPSVPSGNDSVDDVEYSNWSNDTHSISYECISVNPSNGEWKSVGCDERKQVVCETSFDSAETTSNTQLSMESSSPTSSSFTPIIVVVIVGLCIIVVSNIIVALVVRRYTYRRANASSSNAPAGVIHYQDLKTTREQANPDGTYAELQLQPDYEEVTQRG